MYGMLPVMADPAPAHLELPTGVVDLLRGRFVASDGASVALTHREVDLLGYLARRSGQPVSRDALLSDVFGHHPLSSSRALDAAITRLRQKIERDPASPRALFTVHGLGYRLLVGAEPPEPEPPPPAVRRPIALPDRVIDLASGLVEGPDGAVALTTGERLLLEELARRPGQVVPLRHLAQRSGIVQAGALSNAIYRLRRKIEADPERPVALITVRGTGYRLDAQVQEPVPGDAERRAALRSVTDHVGLVLGVADCVVYAWDGGALVQVAAYGPKRAPDRSVRGPLRQRLGEGLVGCCARDVAVVRVGEVRHDPRYLRDLVEARSELCVPITRSGRVVGVLDSESPLSDAFTDHHADVFLSLAAIAAAAFDPPPRGSP